MSVRNLACLGVLAASLGAGTALASDADTTASAGADAVYTALGRPPQCRQCLDEAAEILMEERAAKRPPACV